MGCRHTGATTHHELPQGGDVDGSQLPPFRAGDREDPSPSPPPPSPGKTFAFSNTQVSRLRKTDVYRNHIVAGFLSRFPQLARPEDPDNPAPTSLSLF